MYYDILVLGSGPAGFYSAIGCASSGLKTALVEKSITGGTGFSTGCLPVKAILDRICRIEDAEQLFRETNRELKTDQIYNSVLSDINKRLKIIPDHIETRLKRASVDFYNSDGEFSSPGTYRIDSGEIKAGKIIIATGSEPSAIKDISFSSRVLSHKDLSSLKKTPEKITIIGGDVEGVEFASLFSSLGSSVTIVEQLSKILPGYDRDLVQPIIEDLASKKVKILTSTRINSIDDKNKELYILTNSGKIKCEKILITGNRKRSIPEGIEKTGVKILNNAISVNNNFETNVEGIFAVGDINGIMEMAGAAVQQAVQLVDFLIKGIEPVRNYSILPRAVFAIPRISGAGIQEKDILENKSGYIIKNYSLEETFRGISGETDKGFVKIITSEDNKIKGIWFSSGNADSYTGFSGIMIEKGLSFNEIRRDLYIHPTVFEALFEAGNK